MKLIVFGASGRVGQWVTSIAAARGHAVTAVVRAGAAPIPAVGGARIERVGVLDAASIDGLVPGHEGVISCLGLRRAGASPFARLLSPPGLTACATAKIVSAMRRARVRRIVALSAGGVGTSHAQLTWPIRRLVAAGNVAVAYKDLANMENVLFHSGLDWTAVRPVTLLNGNPTGNICESNRYALFSTVRRADVAMWMIDDLQRPATAGSRAVLLSSASR